MKVLIVNCVYAYGSTGKIVRDIAKGLYQVGIDVSIAFARGDSVSEDWPVIKLASENMIKIQSFCSKITGLSYECSAASTRNLFRLIENHKPDIVNLHCINANTVNLAETIEYLKRKHINTVLSIHAEFPYTGGCGHAYDCIQWQNGCKHCPQFHKTDSQLPVSWIFNRVAHEWEQLRKAYENFEELMITCVSPWLTERARLSPFFCKRNIVSVLNGLDEEIFKPRDVKRLRKKHHLEGKKVLLHVTPNFYSSIKGGKYVIQIAEKMMEEHPDYAIVICGYKGDGSDLPKNIIPIAFTKDQTELAEYYSLADVTLLTSKRETFSMVTAETLCCGTPLVAFKAGGPESIAMQEGSLFCDFGNIEQLYKNVVAVINGDIKLNFDANKARDIYSKATMTKAYMKVYEDIINNR